MKKVIKIYNSLFDYDLKASSFKVYVYLSCFFWWKDSSCVKLETISKRCNMSINTVQSCINELINKDLIAKQACYKDHKRVTNRYKIKRLQGKFTIIERNAFKQDLDNSTFMIFCAISMRKNKRGMAFPSLKTITEDTGLSRTTVIYKVKILKDSGYIHKQHYITIYGDFGNNNHTVFSLVSRAFIMRYIAKQTTLQDWLDKLNDFIKNKIEYINFNIAVFEISKAAFLLQKLIRKAKHINDVNTC